MKSESKVECKTLVLLSRYRKMKRPPKIARPTWITACVAAGRLLDLGPFLLERASLDAGQAAITGFVSGSTQQAAPPHQQLPLAGAHAPSTSSGSSLQGSDPGKQPRNGSCQVNISQNESCAIDERACVKAAAAAAEARDGGQQAVSSSRGAHPRDAKHRAQSLCESEAGVPSKGAASGGSASAGGSGSKTAAAEGRRRHLLRAWQQACCLSAPLVLSQRPGEGGTAGVDLLSSVKASTAPGDQVQGWLVVVRRPSWWEERRRLACEPTSPARSSTSRLASSAAPVCLPFPSSVCGSKRDRDTSLDAADVAGIAHAGGGAGAGAAPGAEDAAEYQTYQQGAHDLSCCLAEALAYPPSLLVQNLPASARDTAIEWRSVQWKLVCSDMALVALIGCKQDTYHDEEMKGRVQKAVEARLRAAGLDGQVSLEVGGAKAVLQQRPRLTHHQSERQEATRREERRDESEQSHGTPALVSHSPSSRPGTASSSKVLANQSSTSADPQGAFSNASAPRDSDKDEKQRGGGQGSCRQKPSTAGQGDSSTHVESMSQIAQEDFAALPLDIQAELRLLPNHRPTRHTHDTSRRKGAPAQKQATRQAGAALRATTLLKSAQPGNAKGRLLAGAASFGIRSCAPPKSSAANARAEAADGSRQQDVGAHGQMGSSGALDGAVLRELEAQMGVS